MLRFRLLVCVLLAASVMTNVTGMAQQQSASSEEPLATAGRRYFTDVLLVTQDGERVRLYTDLLKGKVVVINVFFGTCTGSCPVMAGKLAALQDLLGDRLGKEVFLLSFSVDPETDTPEKLKKYADSFHAKPGWLFLTGPKKDVDFALSKLGQKVSRKEDHLTLFIIGNERAGLWRKVLAPTSTADSVMAIVECVLKETCAVHN